MITHPEKFDQLMCRAFPELFVNRHKSEQESCMAHGFEIPTAWYQLVFDLCSKLHDISVSFHIPIVVDQVKTKFGMLRFYYTVPENRQEDPAVKIINDLVALAELRSQHITDPT